MVGGLILFSAGPAAALLLHRLSVAPQRASAGTTVAGSTAARSAAAPTYLGPADLHAAYSLPGTGAPHQTIAVVSAYDDPTAASDLRTYLSTFKLSACGAARGCFRKVNQAGQSRPLPSSDPTGGTWVTESALGTEVARAVCQSCSILLVEAKGADNADFAAAVATAARMGAQTIETSFAAPEQAGDAATYGPSYSHPGSVVVAATGDSGDTGGATFPAALPGVIAVGGTSLRFNRNGYYGSESAWSSDVGSSGSGCSLYTAAPSWQAGQAASVGCGTKRAVADLSAVASPGALAYISNVQGTRGGGWYPAQGTSLSSPVIAGAIGLAGGGSGSSAALLYARAHSQPRDFHDVTAGETPGCTGQPICAARRGYDGPTGLGSPRGLGAFFPSGGAINPRHPYVTASAGHGRITVSQRFTATLGLSSRNPFAVTATVVVRSARRLRIGRHVQTVTFAVSRVKLSPLERTSVRLQIARAYRGLVPAGSSLAVTVALSVRGTRGRSHSFTQRFSLYRR